MLAARSFRWLVVKIRGLLNIPGTRLGVAMSDD